MNAGFTFNEMGISELFGYDLELPVFEESDGAEPLLEGTLFAVLYGDSVVLDRVKKLLAGSSNSEGVSCVKLYNCLDGDVPYSTDLAPVVVEMDTPRAGLLTITAVYDMDSDTEAGEFPNPIAEELQDFLNCFLAAAGTAGLKEIRALFQTEAYEERGGMEFYSMDTTDVQDAGVIADTYQLAGSGD